jgi:hypothetical protein
MRLTRLSGNKKAAYSGGFFIARKTGFAQLYQSGASGEWRAL